ncbi:MAG TPA: valine--tRNA ligase, partial [Ruminococcaceae bacterium]|nr:valine--tRNA ligase [Oscillospiraceae bacterium]
EIWQALPHDGKTIMMAGWPEYDGKLSFAQASEEMGKIMDAVRAVRNRRSEMNVPPSRKTHMYIETASKETFAKGIDIMKRLAYAENIVISSEIDLDGAVTVVTPDAKIFIPTDDLVDREAELKRLNKELESAQKQLCTANAKLKNEKFLSKAPEKVVDGVKQNAQKLSEHIALLKSGIEALGK